MKYLKISIFSLVLMLLFSTGVYALSLYGSSADKITEANASALMPEPMTAEAVTTVAGIYWLPDYLKGNISRGNDDPDKNPFDEDCEKHYNLHTTCPTPKISTGEIHVTNELTCQKKCICPSSYQYHTGNCSGSKAPTGASCNDTEGDGYLKYTQCHCTSSYPHTTATCKGEYQVGGSSCTDNRGTYYTSCNPRPCSDGGYYDSSNQTNMKCSGVTYGGRTCYSCYQPQCSEGGYKAANDTSMVCSSTSYYGRTCYSCRNKTCADGGYDSASKTGYTCSAVTYAGLSCYSCKVDPCYGLENKSCDYGCQTYYSQCSSKCQSCKTCSKVCESGYSTTACTSSQVIVDSSKKNECGDTCYKCRAKDDNCPSGYQASACSSTQVQTGTQKTEAGSTCYACRAKTCTDYNSAYVSSVPSGQTCTTVTSSTVGGLTCYKDCKAANLTCEDWVKANYPDFSISTGGSYVSGSGKVMLTGNVTTTSPVTISGMVVGPAYFNYDKCKAKSTPTISVTNIDYDGVTLNGGTLANVNVEYDPVSYTEYGSSHAFCQYYGYCNSSMDSYTAQSFYNTIKGSMGYSSCSSYGDICSVLQSSTGCVDYNSNFQSCDTMSYGSCSCSSAAQALCYSSYLRNLCKNNEHSALAGYGTLKDSKINSKKRNIGVVVYPDGGTLTIEGTVSVYGLSRSTPLRIGDNAYTNTAISRRSAKLIINGTLELLAGRDLYYSANGQVIVNASGTLKITYGEWGGIMFNYASSNMPMEVYGKLDISSNGSGGKYANDLEFTWNGKGILKARNGSCIKLQNGGGGSNGGSGTFSFESGAQLSMKGSCKKASSSGSYTVKDNPSNTLYGAFTSHPSGFSGSCSNCY